jgi:hypothetical protein
VPLRQSIGFAGVRPTAAVADATKASPATATCMHFMATPSRLPALCPTITGASGAVWVHCTLAGAFAIAAARETTGSTASLLFCLAAEFPRHL